MGVFPLFFLCLLFISGPSNAEKPPPKAIQKYEVMGNQEDQIPFSDSVFTDQLDTIPVVNPTPTTPTPTTPTPTFNSPPTPTTTQPTIPPPTPTMTQPTIPPPTPTTTQPTPTTPTTTPVSSGGSWCIASPTASDTALQVALDYACGYGGADCSILQSGASCYNPNTVRDHASYAFNDYFQKNPIPTSCNFGGTAQLTNTDPSNGSCRYASPRTAPSTTTSANPTPMMPPPVVPTTPTFDTPTGSSIYGSEPVGTPSSAVSISYCRTLLFITAGLLGSAIAAT
ncbi:PLASMODESMATA CALLOSE-BINDING PROTEIN 1 isoform X2 [Morus notabilis]|uniref:PLASMODESMATA CALLOSE-BINDING PROTEIN 1 isoform X2 n=1 Tax=Morus notabilis TaxID=981085 RepID=UPI000CED79B9|nr:PLASMODESMATA CALLOSE-BINDING PROTEIN 1 isoform X2 [Morus notabilis]